jgi:hypothetical protein
VVAGGVRIRNVALAFVLVVGMGLMLYGALVGDEGTVSIEVSGPDDESTSDLPRLEYDALTPEHQDAFRKSLRTGENVRVSEAPKEPHSVVHYRGDNYTLVTTWGAAVQTTMVISIAGGVVLILIGSLGWYVSGRYFGGLSADSK